VRELLHQNGSDPKDQSIPNYERDPRSYSFEGDIRGHGSDRLKLEYPDKKIPKSLPSSSQSSHHTSQPLLPNFNPANPMFYPQLVHMGGGMSPMGLPFMIPQFGVPSLVSQVQSMPTVGNSIYVQEEKPLRALDKLVTSHKESVGNRDKSAIPHRHKSQRVVSPPSAHSHSSSSKYTSSHHSSLHKSDHTQRPITPAHSNNIKREYPYTETNRNSYNYTMSDLKLEPSMEKDHKRQKTGGSQNMYSSRSGETDAPVLDLSMKTMKAEEARHQRGESLLFDASFNKDTMFGVKSETMDIPQDLSVKSKGSSSSSLSSVGKGFPLNIPFPMQSSIGTFSTGKKESSKGEVSTIMHDYQC